MVFLAVPAFLKGLMHGAIRLCRSDVTPTTDMSVHVTLAPADADDKLGSKFSRGAAIQHEPYELYPKRQKLIDSADLPLLALFYKISKSKLVDFYWVAEQVKIAHPGGATPSHYHQGFQRAFGFPLHPLQEAPLFAGDGAFSLTPDSFPDPKLICSFIPHHPAPQILVRAPKSASTRYLKRLFNMANAGGDQQLFEEHFTVTTYDQSKYDRVARIGASSQDNQTVMTLDINIELYPLAVGEVIHCVLASGLSLDGTKDEMSRGWRDIGGDQTGMGGIPSLADMFDYVCHGKIYKFEDGEDGQTIKCYISFGGLLMALEGPYKKLTPLRVDYVYLLVKKH